MDLQITIFLNKLGTNTFIDLITTFLSSYIFLAILLLTAIIAIYICDKNQRKTVIISILIALAIHLLINEGFFKYLLANFTDLRIRPYLAHPDLITAIGHRNLSASFPSSHMSGVVAVSTVLIYFYKKLIPVTIVFILLMAFARIHDGMHYPTDVIAGTILGVIYGITAQKISIFYVHSS